MTDGGRQRLLQLVPVGPEVEIPAGLGAALDRLFGTGSRPGAPLALDPAWYHPERGQWLSTRVVDALLERWEQGGEQGWLLGITAVDLFASDRTFVFGEATVDGPCALVSTARLRRGADRAMLARRLLVEAVHELGHLGGLGHCPQPSCAMAPSDDEAGVDAKPAAFCTACRTRLLRSRVATS